MQLLLSISIYSSNSIVLQATKRFLASFSDKYTKFIPKDFFDSKMNSYYGAENGIG